MEKEQVFNELMDRMKDHLCPICEFVEFRTNEGLDRFLYDGVNDPNMRLQIVKANGFCNYHSHKLMEFGDPLTHAILYNDLINFAIDDLKNLKLKNVNNNHSECLFCKQKSQNEEGYTKAFLEFFKDSKFKQKYMDNAMLCIHHLVQINNWERQKMFSDKKLLKEINDSTIEKYNIITADLKEIRRKSDYRFTDEEWTESEKTAWNKGVNLFSGIKGM